MEVAIFSEGDADEAGLRVPVEAVLGRATTPTSVPFRSRGWPAVADQLPSVIRSTYFTTDAVGLVVVADGNGSPIDPLDPTNRLRRLREIATRCQPKGRPDRPPLQLAIGIAYPSIEAWWLGSIRREVGEHPWSRRNDLGTTNYSKQDLKRHFYGREFPGTPLATQRMQEGAAQIATDLVAVRTKFPFGLGGLLSDLEKWPRPSSHSD